MQGQYNFLSCRIDLYFQNYKLAIEIDENGHIDRNIDYEINWQKVIEEEVGCKFIRIDPDKEEFDIFRAINEMIRYIKRSTKKTLINKMSTSLLGLELESDSVMKSKAIKFIVKKVPPDYKWQWKPIRTAVKNMLLTKIQAPEKLDKID